MNIKQCLGENKYAALNGLLEEVKEVRRQHNASSGTGRQEDHAISEGASTPVFEVC